MASTTISIKREAYDRLAALKRPDKILRITGKVSTGESLKECLGLWADMPKSEREKVAEGIEAAREAFSF